MKKMITISTLLCLTLISDFALANSVHIEKIQAKNKSLSRNEIGKIINSLISPDNAYLNTIVYYIYDDYANFRSVFVKTPNQERKVIQGIYNINEEKIILQDENIIDITPISANNINAWHITYNNNLHEFIDYKTNRKFSFSMPIAGFKCQKFSDYTFHNLKIKLSYLSYPLIFQIENFEDIINIIQELKNITDRTNDAFKIYTELSSSRQLMQYNLKFEKKEIVGFNISGKKYQTIKDIQISGRSHHYPDEKNDLKFDSIRLFNNYFITEKNQKYGLINMDGEILIPCEYDRIVYNKNNRNTFTLFKNNKKGLLINNKIIAKALYNDILRADKGDYYITTLGKGKNARYGLIALDGKIIFKPIYNKILYFNDKYVAELCKITKNKIIYETENGDFYSNKKLNLFDKFLCKLEKRFRLLKIYFK